MNRKLDKTILVTGATDGIGFQTALELARRGELVILHGRDPDKIARARQEILREFRAARLEAMQADLASLADVRALTGELLSCFDRLDVLINNAGVFMRERRLSVDGYELTFAVNHLAPFALTIGLLPLLRASQARVVTVSSTVHRYGRIDFADLNAEKNYDGYTAYTQSKLANVLFANELAERERGSLTSNSLHPGVISTKLLLTGFSITGASPVQGAATSVYLATAPDVAQTSGRYFSDSQEVPLTSLAQDKATQARLWAVSEQLIGS